MKKRLKENATAYLYIMPFLILYIIFKFYTLIEGFIISFHSWKITDTMKWTGISNYLEILKDPYFTDALFYTFRYVVVSTPIYMVCAFFLAYAIESELIQRKGPFRMTVFLPYVLPVSVVVIIWRFMFSTYTGLINSLLGTNIQWLTNSMTVWPSIIIETLWWTVGYSTVLYMAGLQTVPNDMRDAGKIDGAGLVQTIWYLIIPYLKPTHFMILFLQLVASFKLFGQAYLLTYGNPNGTSRTVIQYIYETGFQKFQMGKASAASFVLFAVVLVCSVPVMRLMNRKEEEL